MTLVTDIKERIGAEERERQAEEQRGLREYLGALGDQCNVLSLADADSSDPNKRAVSLDSVYVRLDVERTIRLRPADLTLLYVLGVKR